MTNSKFNQLFGKTPRKPETQITQQDMDLARSIQEAIEEIVLKIVRHIQKETSQKNLCLAGGVALNCVANGRILQEGIFDNIWIQPASGDAGGALGAALATWYQYLNNPRIVNEENDAMQGAYLGSEYSNSEIQAYLDANSIPYQKIENSTAIAEKVADLINSQKVIGWFQGKMEFGPRALGARSIIGDARSPKMQEIINLKIKFRESFRPFAPSILAEKVAEHFDINTISPYMLLVAKVKKPKKNIQNKKGLEKLKIIRSDIPAVTHVDYSARVQTVHKETNPLYHQLISIFEQKYGCPAIINTSFNVRGEPIVESPADAYNCFMKTNIDYLALGNFLLAKNK